MKTGHHSRLTTGIIDYMRKIGGLARFWEIKSFSPQGVNGVEAGLPRLYAEDWWTCQILGD